MAQPNSSQLLKIIQRYKINKEDYIKKSDADDNMLFGSIVTCGNKCALISDIKSVDKYRDYLNVNSIHRRFSNSSNDVDLLCENFGSNLNLKNESVSVSQSSITKNNYRECISELSDRGSLQNNIKTQRLSQSDDGQTKPNHFNRSSSKIEDLKNKIGPTLSVNINKLCRQISTSSNDERKQFSSEVNLKNMFEKNDEFGSTRIGRSLHNINLPMENDSISTSRCSIYSNSSCESCDSQRNSELMIELLEKLKMFGNSFNLSSLSSNGIQDPMSNCPSIGIRNKEEFKAHLLKITKEVKDRVDELIRTEVAYIEVLKHIVVDYVPELSRKDAPHTAEFTKANIFANIEEIYKFHSEILYPKMNKNRRNINRLANVFIELDGMFMVYDEYNRNKSKSTYVIHEHRQFFMRKQKELGSKLDLASCLLGPVQRLPRYCLMLDALLKSYTKYVTFLKEEAHYSEGTVEKLNFGSSHESDEEEEVDHDNDMKCIEKARDGIRSTLNKIENNMVLVNIKKLKVNLNDLGSLLRHDEFSVTPAEQKRSWPMRCFLFEVALLFTIVDKSSDEIYIFHDCIELSKLGFTPPENDSSYRFSVWSEKRNLKNYALEAAPKVSADWVKCISALLWEEAASKKEKIKKEQSIKWKDSMRSVKRPSMHRGLPEKPAPPPQSTKPTLNDAKSMSDKRKKRKKEVNSNVHDALKFVGKNFNVMWSTPHT